MRFDHAAASAAIAQAQASLRAVSVLAETEQSALAQAQRGWVGAARETTDVRLLRHQRALHDAALRLRRLIIEMSAAVDDAAVEQLRRDRMEQQGP
ncbi:MAG: hypothetical protein ACC660_02545 [Acidimicrobiales bacterium]